MNYKMKNEEMEAFVLRTLIRLQNTHKTVTIQQLADGCGMSCDTMKVHIGYLKEDGQIVSCALHAHGNPYILDADTFVSPSLMAMLKNANSSAYHFTSRFHGFENDEVFKTYVQHVVNGDFDRKPRYSSDMECFAQKLSDTLNGGTEEKSTSTTEDSLKMKKYKASDMSIREISDFLDQHIYGQKDAKKAAAMLLWNHLHGRKRNCLFIGPSGCGKTEIFRTLKKIYPNIVIFDCSNVSADGWRGRKKATDMFRLMEGEGLSDDDMEHAIVVCDEFDKLCDPKTSSSGENVAAQIQAEFLTLVEGTKVQVTRSGSTIDTTHISFAFLGAFERLYQQRRENAEAAPIGFGGGNGLPKMQEQFSMEDVISFGVRTEIAGRIGTIAQLNPLRATDFMRILNDPNVSPLQKVSQEYGVNFTMPDSAKMRLARAAEKNNMGVRFMTARVQKLADDAMYLLNGDTENFDEIELGSDLISETSEPVTAA